MDVLATYEKKIDEEKSMTLYILEWIATVSTLVFIWLAIKWMNKICDYNESILLISRDHIKAVEGNIMWLNKEVNNMKVKISYLEDKDKVNKNQPVGEKDA